MVFDIRHVEARYIDARDNRGIRLKYRNIPKFTSSYRGSIYNVSMFGIIVVYDLSSLKISKFTCTHIVLICAYVIMQHFDPQSVSC